MERDWRVYEPTEDQIEAACAEINSKWDEKTRRERIRDLPFVYAAVDYDWLMWCRCGQFLGWIVNEWKGSKIVETFVASSKYSHGRLCVYCASERDTSLLNMGCSRAINNDWHEQNTCDQPPWWEQIANED